MDSQEAPIDGGLASDVPEPQQDTTDSSHQNDNIHQAENMDDSDRCRICRGEGTKEEELFYPCKCNGSIKYVHQSCLVEWLSHSQKKHCELCKTPFRFTKLYDAHMPQSVPVPIFLRQAVVQAWKSCLTYARFHLVVFVWMFWLPWCMRAVWRGLFWLGDGGWVDWKSRSLEVAGVEDFGSSTPPAWSRTMSTLPMAPEALASMIMSSFSSALKEQGIFFVEALKAQSDEPLTFRMIKGVHRLLFGESTKPASTTSPAYPTATPSTAQRPPSWLSESTVLKSVTRSTIINNVIIDTVEGQIITLLIVVTFIVMFLIREWVMQQQQNIFMGPEAQQAVNARHEDNAQGEEQEREQDRDQADEAAADDPAGINQAPRVLLQARGRLQRRATHTEGQRLDPLGHDVAVTTGSDALPAWNANEDVTSLNMHEGDGAGRPSMPDRGTTNPVDVRRSLDEDLNLSSLGNIRTTEDLWSHPFQNPSEVLGLLERQDRLQEFPEIVSQLRSLRNANTHSEDPTSGMGPASEQPKSDENISANEAPTEGAPLSTFDNTQRPNTAERERLLNDMLSSYAPPIFPPSRPEDHPETWHLDQPEIMHVPLDTSSRPNSQSQSHPVLALPPQTSLADDVDFEHTAEGQNSPANGSTNGITTENNNESTADAVTEQALERIEATHTLLERLMVWMWGIAGTADNDHADVPVQHEEHVVRDIAEEAPFVPATHRQNLRPAPDAVPDPGPAQDADAVAAAVQAGMDPNPADALDDLEDMEGVMELIGMQGPVIGLVQNGMFCALLVSLTMVAALWVPYMFGKIFLIVLARPLYVLQQPLRFASTMADMIVDFCIFAAGGSYYWIDRLFNFLCSPIGRLFPILGDVLDNRLLAETAKSYAESALKRLAFASIANSELVAKGFDIPTFSIVAHESLRLLDSRSSTALAYVFQLSSRRFLQAKATLETSSYVDLPQMIGKQSGEIFELMIGRLSDLLSITPTLLHINPLRISISTISRAGPIDYTLAAWSSKDRSIAITCGYLLFALLGVLYLHMAAALKGTNKKGRVEGWLADLLYQAGGVMKVILIISIEMIVFPLYCGILLDVALLPLFANATVLTRFQYALSSPNTALFVHWFIGTCYMFHFALFVSMCRKILRSGVLFFIRDPDDPTFHPVRDVLERSVSTQLWKISFSAFVYGALVLVCLGGVVWGVAAVLTGVFPIQWSSSEPILEFPVDILFYNFLMPVAVKYCKPANGLTKLYSWWFHKCGRWLRLSNFLFNEEHLDEKGRPVRRTWKAWFRGEKAEQSKELHEDAPETAADETVTGFEFDGKRVEAPSSDQLRIPKGHPTFFEVNEANEVVNVNESSKTFLEQNSEYFTRVYLPPRFRMRIAALVILIWMFAAATGLSVTIVPLVLGRLILSNFTPDGLRMNDIYALSLGIYLLGGALYAGLKFRHVRAHLDSTLSPHRSTIHAVAAKAKKLAVRVLGLAYTYSAFTIFLPALVSMVIEFYLIIPLHTFLSTHPAASEQALAASEPTSLLSTLTKSDSAPVLPHPIVHLIQDWTLGILYVKVVGRLILWSRPSRPATALRAIVRNGWLSPDIWLATRGFIVPSIIFSSILLTLPLAPGWIVAHTLFAARSMEDEFFRSCIYRYSYPAVFATALAAVVVYMLAKAFGRWRKRVRDEVYLIGERLHNYGDAKRKVDKGKAKEKVERPVLGRLHTA